MLEIIGYRFERNELLFQVEYPDFVEEQTLAELLDEHGKDTVEQVLTEYFRNSIAPIVKTSEPIPYL